ncbi:YqeB family protein [Streptomyces mayteni]
MPTEAEEPTTQLWLPLADRLVLLIGAPLLGAGLGLLLPSLADWLMGLPWVPMRGPFELVASFEGPWVGAALGGLGLLAGLALVVVAFTTSLKVTLTDSRVDLEKNDTRWGIDRAAVDAVFMDGKRLVILDRESRQLLRDTSEEKPADVARAFAAHGYPWVEADPYAELYRRWVPDTPEMPGAVNALLKAREVALEKKASADIAELREEVEKLGFAVRDESTRQYWRPLVRS